MKPFDIVTLTINPSVDKSAKFNGLIAEQKIRCDSPRYDAGGGVFKCAQQAVAKGSEIM